MTALAALLFFCIIATVVMVPVAIGVFIMLGVTRSADTINKSGFHARRELLRARKNAARRRRGQ